MKVRVINRYEDVGCLKSEWDALIKQDHLDVSVSYIWTKSLWNSHLNKKDINIIVIEGKNEIQGIFPYHVIKKTIKKLPVKVICGLAELSNIHNDLIIKSGKIEIIELIFEKLSELQKWDTIEFSTIVDGSIADEMLKSYLSAHNYRYSISKGPDSPYIEICNRSYEEYLSTLKAKARSNFKRKQNKINREGDVKIKRVFDREMIINIISLIESNSWKYKATSSIVNKEHQFLFFKSLLQRFEDNFIFFALFFDGNPISYSMGINYNQKYYSLKTSYIKEYRKLSPGIVLRLALLQYCFENNFNEFDFSGKNESWKKEFTDTIRTHTNYLIFNKTFYPKSLYYMNKLN